MQRVTKKIEPAKKHYWATQCYGMLMASTNICPLANPLGKVNYMGWTTDFMWPKRMNTGRILYKAINMNKAAKNQKRILKKLKKIKKSTLNA